MTFKPAIWYPIAVVLSLANLVAVWFAVPGPPWHPTIHAALALSFGLWALRLRRGSGGNELQAGLEALELEVSTLRHELSETQERLDFVERHLAQGQEPRRMDPPR